MISITFKPKTMELKINGHAGQNKKGKDIVCSAVSTLFYTLGEALMQSMHMMEESPIVKDEEGDGYIVCKTKKEYEANVSLIYWTVLVGMEMLANQYPKYVKFFIEN